MIDESRNEVERIRSVYAGYGEFAATRWAPGNSGNLAIVAERNRVLDRLLSSAGLWPPRGRRILDVGCGGGDLLAHFASGGADLDELFGVDLLDERIAVARERLPGAHFSVANGEELGFPDRSFDVVTMFVVLSSILDERMATGLCDEVTRLLRPEGAVVIYEFRVPSPANRQVRAVRRADIRRLFPHLRCTARSLTLVPPLARRLGKATKLLYRPLAALPFLRTHNMFLLRTGA